MATGQVREPVRTARRRGQMPGAVIYAVVIAILVGLGVAGPPIPVHADTLRNALESAYRTNPRLDAARARLRAFDEDVPQALSGWRPVITGSGDVGYRSFKTKPRGTSMGRTNNWGYSLNVKQNLFDGFQTTNRVRGAEATVRAERETLRLVEQQVLLRAVTAYMNVIRDRAIVKLNSNNVSVLTRALRAARARRAEREITRTDVAQSRARRARAVSRLDEARATLKAGLARYRQVIGVRAGKLRRPSYRSSLIPSTLRAALKQAQDNHPIIMAAKYREQVERYQVDRVRGELLPDVRLEASYGKRFNDTVNVSQEEDARITGRITVPFYRGGQVHSRVRQAKHRHVARLQEIELARQDVETQVISAWSRLRAQRSKVRSGQVQLSAARTALEGVGEEERVGQRTIIELLNAQQELINANVALTRTRADLVVAAYTMIAAAGRLSARQLADVPEVYDPEEHYLEVRNKRFGISIASDEALEGRDDVHSWDEGSMLGAPLAQGDNKRRASDKRASDKRGGSKRANSKKRRRAARPGKASSSANAVRRANLAMGRQPTRLLYTGDEIRDALVDQLRPAHDKSPTKMRDEIGTPAVPGRRSGAGRQQVQSQRRSKSRSPQLPVLDRSARNQRPLTDSAGQKRPEPVSRTVSRKSSHTGQTTNNTARVLSAAPPMPPAPVRRAHPLTTASIAPPGAAPVQQQRREQVREAGPAPRGFRGALGGANSQTRTKSFRPAADLSLMNPNRQVTVIRGARLD